MILTQNQLQPEHSHSTMYLLKLAVPVALSEIAIHSHSTMYLLKQVTTKFHT